jgi:hypothetical protein
MKERVIDLEWAMGLDADNLPNQDDGECMELLQNEVLRLRELIKTPRNDNAHDLYRGMLCAICLWPVRQCQGNGCQPNTLIPASQVEALCARHGFVPRGKEHVLEWLDARLKRKKRP